MTADLFTPTASTATISACGRFRYTLERRLSAEPARVLWIMLNPSTADASLDDPTIRRCIGFSRAWGYGGLVVANLYAYRATDPRELFGAVADPIGPENDVTLTRLIAQHASIVCAWGGNASGDNERVELVRRVARDTGRLLLCLGTNKDGSPKHPLYLKDETRSRVWSVRDLATDPIADDEGGPW